MQNKLFGEILFSFDPVLQELIVISLPINKLMIERQIYKESSSIGNQDPRAVQVGISYLRERRHLLDITT